MEASEIKNIDKIDNTNREEFSYSLHPNNSVRSELRPLALIPGENSLQLDFKDSSVDKDDKNKIKGENPNKIQLSSAVTTGEVNLSTSNQLIKTTYYEGGETYDRYISSDYSYANCKYITTIKCDKLKFSYKTSPKNCYFVFYINFNNDKLFKNEN